jgi:hypothetical protein
VIEAIGALPEAASDAEAFDQVAKVGDFLSTISKVERATGLDFGSEIRTADIRTGLPEESIASLEQLRLTPVPRNGRLRASERSVTPKKRSSKR